jgi:hypothetical protein
MLSIQQVQAHLARVSYKPGWSFEAYQGAWEGHHIVINTQVPDAYGPGRTVTLNVHSMLPPLEDTSALERWLMWRLARIEVHEMREFFRVDGKIVDDPHAEFADRDL